METWVNTVSGAPIEADFGTTVGQGSPLVIDKDSGEAYFFDGTVKKLPFGSSFSLSWWGWIVNSTYDAAEAAINTAAFIAAQDFLILRAATRINKGLETLLIPPGDSWVADSGNGIALDIIAQMCLDFGAANPATLHVQAGITAICTQSSQSYGQLGKLAVARATSANGTIIRNARIRGVWNGGAEAENHGIQIRAKTNLEYPNVKDMAGDGIHVWAAVGAADGVSPGFGNANTGLILFPTTGNCRDGLSFNGSDANAWTVILPNMATNRRAGIFESSLLGNSYFGGQFATNCITAYNTGVSADTQAAACSYLGNRYGVVYGQEANASVTAPSGTTADTLYWYYIKAGGVSTGYPAWFSGMFLRAGGPAISDENSAANGFRDCYCEFDQPKFQGIQGTIVDGGLLSDWVFQNTAANKGTTVLNSGQSGKLIIGPTVAVEAGDVTLTLGESNGNSSDYAVKMAHSTIAPLAFSFRFVGNNIQYLYSTNTISYFTGPNTTDQFNTGAAVPYVAFFPRIAIPSTIGGAIGTGRQICRAAASSSTYVAAAGGATIDVEARAALVKLAADFADLRTKLQAANLQT